jgi:hypothetical protein
MIFRRLALGLLAATAISSVAHASGVLGDVFVISMENHNFMQPGSQTSPNQIFGNSAAPFQNGLLVPGTAASAQTSWAGAYYNVLPNTTNHIHPSEPNYVWSEAGSNFGIAGDADPGVAPNPSEPNGNFFTTPHLTGLLQSKGISWTSYQEDIQLAENPDLGSTPSKSFSGTDPGFTDPYNGSHQFNYAPKHNPQVFFTDTGGPGSASHYEALTQLQSDLNNNTVSRYNWISPDQFNDSHTALSTAFTYHGVTYGAHTDQEAIAQGDNFLSIVVPEIMASKAYKNNGAIVIWWDETEGGDDLQHTLEEIVISPLAKGNAFESMVPMTHSSDLLSWEELFGLQRLGDSATPGTNDLSSLFKAGAFPEPASGAILLASLGLAGLARRRNRK